LFTDGITLALGTFQDLPGFVLGYGYYVVGFARGFVGFSFEDLGGGAQQLFREGVGF
jgi:hypothetical protein